MWPFKNKKEEVRAETELDVDTSTKDGQLLKALLSGEIELSKEQALEVPAVAACVRLICDTVSMVPIRLYRIDPDTSQLEEVRDDPRVTMLNVDTGDTLDATQFKRAMVRDYLLDRGGYAYIDKKGNTVKSLRYVEAGSVGFSTNSDPIFKDYDILVNGESYRPYQFLKLLRNTKDGMEGTSIVAEHQAAMLIAWRLTRFQDRLLRTGGNKKGFLKSPKTLTDPAITALKDAWRRLYEENSENVVVLNNGLEFQESSESSTEMQINETVNTVNKQISQIFGVPTAFLSRDSGLASKEDRTVLVQYCIQPILAEFINALNRDLLMEKEKGGYKFDADISEFTKADILERYQAYEIASKNGFMQIDEIRYRENLKPLGLKFVKLGLQDVLYYPEDGTTYVPNMNQIGSRDIAMEDREITKKQKEAELKAAEGANNSEN